MKPREFLSTIGSSITVADAAPILQTTQAAATKILSRWTKQGWLERVGQGLYVASPISSSDVSTISGEFALVTDIIGIEGYICGWSALSHHGVTEQIFINLSLASFKWPRYKEVRLKKSKCCIFKISSKDAIGLEILWYQDKKIFISDIHKTIMDILAHPLWGGGLFHVVDCFRNYLSSTDCNINQVLKYAEGLNIIGVFYKRLGYLLEINNGNQAHIDHCYARKTSGYSPLDPKTKKGKLNTRWQLIIPEHIKI